LKPPRTKLAMRPGGRADRGFVRELARRVFAAYGEYDRMIPEWLGGPGVRCRVALEDGERVGFAVICLARLPRSTELAVDLMAIAVVPEKQGAGLGRWLLELVIEEAEQLAESTDLPLTQVTLTVADANERARRLFESRGFRAAPGPPGTYPAGQPAVKMALPLPRTSANRDRGKGPVARRPEPRSGAAVS
jgi:GNAT superfamily N-acetyltransferase